MSNNQDPDRDQVLQNSLNGEYKFDIQALFKDGWALTQSSKWVIIQMAVVTLVLAMLIVVLIFQVMGIQTMEDLSDRTQLSINMVVTGLMAPLVASLMMAAMKHSLGVKSQVSDITKQLPKTLPLAFTSLLVALLVNMGLLLFIIPGLYLSIAAGFAILLVADKNLAPVQSILLSIKVVNVYWLDFVKLNLIFLALFVVVILTFGIAIIWVAPLYYHIKGILYRDLFGALPSSDGETKGSQNDQSTFEA